MSQRLIRIMDTQQGEVDAQVSDPNPSGQSPLLLSGYAGGSNQSFKASGNYVAQIASAGINPVGTANDNVVAVFQIPASFFDVAGRGINILAQGSTVSNVNTKTIKIIIGAANPVVGQTISGGTTIASIVLNSAAGSGGWQLEANVYKYGNTGSNTQIALHAAGQGGNVVASLSSPSLLTLAENGVINVAITGNAATAASDIVFNFLEAFAMN